VAGDNPFDELEGQDLVVATPELVTFDYQLAGPGSRFLAQIIDFPLQVALLVAAIVGGVSLGQAVQDPNLLIVATIVLALIVVWGYYPISEAVWSGKTLGKFAFGLRVVGDQGEPITVSQAVIRNLVRLIDFLPFFYGVGIIALFWNGRGKRLGDLAAGTVVVRERAPVRLGQLTAAAAGGHPGASRLSAADSSLLRQVDPEFKRFVVAYAGRRVYFDPWRRQVLAGRVEPSLRRLLPEMVATSGPVAALERLADVVATELPAPAAPIAENASHVSQHQNPPPGG
jgi:uncharacterized RDD family membrane protein YckC